VHLMGLGHEEAVRKVIEAAGLLPRPEPPTAEQIGELEARRSAEEEARRAAEEEAVRAAAAEEEARSAAERAPAITESPEGFRFVTTRVHRQPEQPQPQFQPPSEEEPAPAEARPTAAPGGQVTSPTPAEEPQQPGAAGGWAPTHMVPAGGMQAWQAPHPQAPQSASLQPGLPVQVVERLGDWARVVASNGWWGWVDGRILP
jgi:hypothetical protein